MRMEIGFILICLLVITITRDCTCERCDDWGEDTRKLTQAYDGEPVRIRCPLFEGYLKHNYSAAHSAGLTLMWYWTGKGKDLEEPINIRLPDNRISKDKDILWFRPSLLNDTGNYTCMLRNTTFCLKIAFPLEVLKKDPKSCVSNDKVAKVFSFPLDETSILHCPDTEDYYPAGVTPNVNWYMHCELVDGFVDRDPDGLNLKFLNMLQRYEGNYTCIVSYEENGREYNLTRTMYVKAIASRFYAKAPEMRTPSDKQTFEFQAGGELNIPCDVYFSYVENSFTEIGWTINGKSEGDFTDPRIQVNESVLLDAILPGAKAIKKELRIKNITPDELKHNYTCTARNTLGVVSRQALVKEKVGTPRYITELACGLGATLFLVVCFVVVYHVYWLEMVLFYRAHFGTDETIGDGKEYDVYVSYARNAEEEEFVLVTLRGVLENEFGYKLCIFDRDSLPGGIVTDETLSFIKKSRRLLVVVSPSYVHQGTQALLELKAGLQNMASQGNIRLVLVQHRSIKNKQKVKELKLAQSVLGVIKWKGEKSKYPGGRFWKQLHVALPVKKTSSTKNSCSFQMVPQNLEFGTECSKNVIT
ncbi:interleukin-1 receptor accessory protein isoform X1 [Bufo gargarizans]|uniref:interleukin-1 receptor accessory protein isoform X1 n=2 Tax=Bufo gargarizans TaxID=30331 RepID=UPI001CF3371C|nr:interleukin-1 receptor accessory protein isoform X1 [Bufo gargarizans]